MPVMLPKILANTSKNIYYTFQWHIAQKPERSWDRCSMSTLASTWSGESKQQNTFNTLNSDHEAWSMRAACVRVVHLGVCGVRVCVFVCMRIYVCAYVRA